MSQDINQILITDYLKDLGVDEEGAQLYTTLISEGPSSIFELSRQSGIERTKIYRVIDELIQKGILEEQLDYKKRLLKAASLNNIKHLVDIQAQKAQDLTTSYETFSEIVNKISHNSPTTSVQFYRGKEGIKQMLWNELRAKSESLCFIYKTFDTYVGDTYFDHWAEEFGKRGLSSREIRTDIFNKSFEDKINPICFHMKNVKIKYISSKKFPMKHGMSIYDNVVSFYDFWDNQIFGVEMYNQQVADMQRIFFEDYWEKGQDYSNDRYRKKIIKIY